jgi:hypothetical protein
MAFVPSLFSRCQGPHYLPRDMRAVPELLAAALYGVEFRFNTKIGRHQGRPGGATGIMDLLSGLFRAVVGCQVSIRDGK